MNIKWRTVLLGGLAGGLLSLIMSVLLPDWTLLHRIPFLIILGFVIGRYM
jgi:hypothetical protein